MCACRSHLLFILKSNCIFQYRISHVMLGMTTWLKWHEYRFGIFGAVIRIRKLSLLLVLMLRMPNTTHRREEEPCDIFNAFFLLCTIFYVSWSHLAPIPDFGTKLRWASLAVACHRQVAITQRLKPRTWTMREQKKKECEGSKVCLPIKGNSPRYSLFVYIGLKPDSPPQWHPISCLYLLESWWNMHRPDIVVGTRTLARSRPSSSTSLKRLGFYAPKQIQCS